MIQAKRFKPEAVVQVFTEKGDLVARSKPDKDGKAIDAEVLSVSTNNDLATDAGVFTVTLASKNRWDRAIASNDLVIIGMKRNPEDSDEKATVFYGLVDAVEYSSTIQSGQVQQQVTITGRNFAKAFINFEIGVVQDGGEIGSSIGWLRGRITFASQSSAQIIQQLFDVFIKKYMNYEFSNGKTLLDLLKISLNSREGESMVGETSFVNYQGSMYNFFKELIDEPFNQMYFEVLDGQPTFILRETPFNEEPWKKLPRHTITDEDVVTAQFGRNDIETYTLFSVGVSNHFGTFGSQGTLGVKPLVYEPYLKKYGIRRLHRYSNYIGISMSDTNTLQPTSMMTLADTPQSPVAVPLDSINSGLQTNGKSPADLAREYAQDLFNWNVMNPSFYNGHITVRGENHYKVGDRLLYKTYYEDADGKKQPLEMEFFIEGVSHDFVNFSHWTTKLSVTRGLPEAGANRFEPPWGAFKEYSGGGVGDPTPEELTQIRYQDDMLLLQRLGFGGYSGGYINIGYGGGLISGGSSAVAQYYLSSTFKQQRNFGENRGSHTHKGEDLSAPRGTKIYALYDGKVVKNAYQAGGAGNYIVLQHANGVVTKYFHMRERSTLPVGKTVSAGTLIGYVGSTGRSSGPHLHLEIWVNGVAKNPIPILKQLASYSGSSSSSSQSSNWWYGAPTSRA